MSYFLKEKSFSTQVGKFAIKKAFGKKSGIYFLYGMRRSGNHACMNWLINALEGRESERLSVSETTYFSITKTGRTVVLNDISTLSDKRYLELVLFNLNAIRRADYLVISAEDVFTNYQAYWRVPDRAKNICVRRSTLNLLASRYQSINSNATRGISKSTMQLNEGFFKKLKSVLNDESSLIWDFDRWLADCRWREAFLQKLGLEIDILPMPSIEGGGSSYRSADSRSSNLMERYKETEPREHWKSFLLEAKACWPSVFTKQELESIENL